MTLALQVVVSRRVGNVSGDVEVVRQGTAKASGHPSQASRHDFRFTVLGPGASHVVHHHSSSICIPQPKTTKALQEIGPDLLFFWRELSEAFCATNQGLATRQLGRMPPCVLGPPGEAAFLGSAGGHRPPQVINQDKVDSRCARLRVLDEELMVTAFRDILFIHDLKGLLVIRWR